MPPEPPNRPLKERLLRWAPYGAVALMLLVASEILWRWQTWPVRELLGSTGVAGP